MAAVEGVQAPAGVLERERELGGLRALLDDARAGRGRLLAVEAPPGMGKTTLLAHAAAAAAQDGLQVLRATGRELERELGWGVARSLFEPWLLGRPAGEREALLAGPAAGARPLLVAEFDAAAPAGPDGAFALLHGLYWLTVRAAERRPLVLVVDDLQWADEPSLRFLLYLAGRVQDHPVALLVAARSGEAGAGGRLPLLLSEPGAVVDVLAPLSEAAVAALVREQVPGVDAAFCARCFELTAGNPLFLRELVRATQAGDGVDPTSAAERAAGSLARLVTRRLAALPADARALARAVAVVEGGIAPEHAGALAELDAPAALRAADVLARADLLRPGAPLEFAHPLVRAAVYGALGLHERSVLHAGAAGLLRDAGATPEQVAVHLLQVAPAGDEAAVRTLRAAAADALAHGVPASATTFLERALREPPAPGEEPELRAELGRAGLLAGRADAITHLERAVQATPGGRRRAELRVLLARTLHDFARPEDACAVCEEGRRELAGGDPDLDLDLEAAWLTSAMVLADRAEEVQAAATAVLARPAAATRAARTLQSKAMNVRLYRGGTAAELAPLARRLWADGRMLADVGLGTQAVGHVGSILSFCDDYATARAVLETARARAREEGYVTYVAATSQLLSRQAAWTGPLPDAAEDAQIAFDLFADGLQLYLAAAGCCLVRAHAERGDVAAAAAVLERVDAGPPPVGMFGAWRWEAAGRLAAAQGDHAAALEAFLGCGERLAGAVVNPALFHWRSGAALAALQTGDRPLAERLAAQETALAQAWGAPRAVGVARRTAGLVARGEPGVELLAAAVELHAACGARVEHALSLTELGAAVRRAGRPGEARALLREAIERAEAVGAAPLAARARQELTLAGGRAPAARDVTAGLTPSELRVARLAAGGRTNRQIADELFVTIKAVEWHLGNAYRKLDIRGRAQLAGALDRLEPAPGRT